MNSTCVCGSGWTSRADFELDYAYDCDINATVIQGFAFIAICVSACGVLLCSWSLFVSVFVEHRKIESDRKIRMLVGYLVHYVGLMLASTPKAQDPVLNVIGPDSILSAIGSFLFFWPACTGWSYFIILTAGQIPSLCRIEDKEILGRLKDRLHFLQRIAVSLAYFSATTGIYIFLAVFDSEHSDLYLIGCVCTVTIFYIGYGSVVIYILNVVLNETRTLLERISGARADDLSKLRRIVSIADIAFKVLIVGLGPPHVMFAFWGFLRRKYTYLLWLTYIFEAFAAFIIVLSQGAKSSRKTNRGQPNVVKSLFSGAYTSRRVVASIE